MKKIIRNKPLSREDESIKYIKEHEPPEGYIVAFSGGKDSIVMYDLVKKADVKYFPYYVSSGLEPPEMVKFVITEYPEVKVVRPKVPYWKLIHKHGYPTGNRRWCCYHLRKEPMEGINIHRLVGVRAEESARRKKLPRTAKVGTGKKAYILYKPIFHWLEWEVWDYIESNDLKYPELYDQGLGRVGCMVCPFHSYKVHMVYKKRWPKTFNMFEKMMKKMWRERGYDQHISFEAFVDNWYRGKYLSIDRLEKDAKKRLLL